jgi:hypothetical protein
MWKTKLKCDLLQLLILTILRVSSLPGWQLWVRTFRNEGQGSATYTQDVILPHKISWASTWRLARFSSVTQSLCKKEPRVGVVLQNKKTNIYVLLQGAEFKPGTALLPQQLLTYFQPPCRRSTLFLFSFSLTKTSTSIWPTLHYFQPPYLLQTVFFFFWFNANFHWHLTKPAAEAHWCCAGLCFDPLKFDVLPVGLNHWGMYILPFRMQEGRKKTWVLTPVRCWNI